MGGSESSPEFNYSIGIPGSEKPGESPAYVNPAAKAYLSGSIPSGARTLYENFKHSARVFSERPFLGTRILNPDGSFGDYSWVTYDEVNRRAERIGWGLSKLGLSEPNEDGHAFLGLYSKNRTDWVITDLACVFQTITSIPIYDTLQSDALDYIVTQTSLPAIACSDKSIQNILKLRKEGLLRPVRILIQFEPVSDALKAECQSLSIEIYSLEEVSQLATAGVDNPPTPSSLFTICYTSGTTGRAKGAIIKQSSMVSTIAGLRSTPGFEFVSEDSYLSYLPLAHMMERIAIHYLIQSGASIGFFQGEVLKLKEDLAALKPTIFLSVPRLFNRFHDLISQQLNDLTGAKKLLAGKALSSKMHYYRSEGIVTHKLWDSLVFSKIKNVLGGRVRIMATGSAPISGDVLAFLRIAFSCPLIEAFGQTETCAASFFTHFSDPSTGHIGGPSPTIECKIMDVPEMNYLSTDVDEQGNSAPRGELCMRGPPVFAGYYKNPEQTDEAIDAQGWLHSGDIVVRLPNNGAFKIIDRKKNNFKLQQGEYVAVEKIEMVYNKSFMIAQLFVYGDSLQSYLVAIIVPDEAYIRKKWTVDNGVAESTSFDEICKIPKLKADILADMNQKAKEGKLLGFEVVKKIHLESKIWTPEDLLTPTQKLMRFNAKKKYQNEINEMYAEPL